jgi:cation diffusion facilitator CzcD-associated flavoprotein CzcO
MEMYDVKQLGKFTLSAGAHEENDHRRCFMEAAIIAAGFRHRKVLEIDSCPPCFSRVFAGYAMWLNDVTPDYLRDGLLVPLIVRLADTADTREAEAARLRFIADEFMRRVNGYIFKHITPDYWGWKERILRDLINLEAVVSNNAAVTRILNFMWTPAHIWARKTAGRHQKKIFTEATKILDEAMELRQDRPVKHYPFFLHIPAACKVF